MTQRPNPQDKRPKSGRKTDKRFQPPSNEPPLEKINMEPEERFPRVPPPEKPASRPAPKSVAKPKPKRKGGATLANLMTGVLVLLTIAVAGGFVWASQNPYHPMNPIARPTPLPVIITATFLPATPTIPVTPTTEPTPQAVADMMASEMPGSEPTLGLSSAGSADATPTPLGGAVEPTAVTGGFPFVALGDAIYTENENERGCNWASVAGVVYDAAGEPLTGVGVRLTNVETSEPITVYTGSSSRFPDGYEYVVNNAPTTRAYMVAVVDSSGTVLSEETMVVTSQRCNQNVLVMNFEQVAGG